MKEKRPEKFNSIKITSLVLYGSLGVSITLTILLLFYDILISREIRVRLLVAVAVIIYLFIVLHIIRKGKSKVGGWLIVALYCGVSFSTLFQWGLNASVGIFASSFVIILTGVLLGSRAIIPITITLAAGLFIIHTLHFFNFFSPELESLSKPSDYFDLLSYITILGIFALVIWISNNQIERSLSRAKKAEAALRAQKESLALALEQESAQLRKAHFQETQQLYKFATLGQSTAATLHELSNHLSILNIDISDLNQAQENSKAIANAQESIEHINLMISQIRRKLDSYDNIQSFAIGRILRKAIKDFSERLIRNNITFRYESKGLDSSLIEGDPLALIQIVTIVVNNAIEACAELPNPSINLSLSKAKDALQISISDNGLGLTDKSAKLLFRPQISNKPSGLGVGLYIAKQLAESHFGGSIYLNNKEASQSGAHFIISIPFKVNKVIN